MNDSIWIWQVTRLEDAATALPDVTGFDVEALDGHVGKVDEATYDNERGALVVDTGFWIFGKKRKVLVACTKDQIKSAPDFEEQQEEDESYRSGVGSYYASLRGDPIAPTPGIEHQPNLR